MMFFPVSRFYRAFTSLLSGVFIKRFCRQRNLLSAANADRLQDERFALYRSRDARAYNVLACM